MTVSISTNIADKNELAIFNYKNSGDIFTTVAPLTTMGIQSQKHNGSIKACLKRGTRVKKHHSQLAIDGGVAFVPHLHCKQCKALRNWRQKNHRQNQKKHMTKDALKIERLGVWASQPA